jgi:hypothetical protein
LCGSSASDRQLGCRLGQTAAQGIKQSCLVNFVDYAQLHGVAKVIFRQVSSGLSLIVAVLDEKQNAQQIYV